MSTTSFPLGARITLADLEGDVHPLLHRLRASEPVSWVTALDCWLVTRYDLAIQVMRDSSSFTVDHPGFSTAQIIGASMLSKDGEEHRRHRRPFEHPFRQKELEKSFALIIAQKANLLLEDLAEKGQADLRRDYAGPVAVHSMIRALGLEAIPVKTVLGWYDDIVEAVSQITAGKAVSREGQRAFAELRAHLLPALRRDPKSNLLAMASGLAGALTDAEVMSNAAVLLFGGIETTEGMIANAFYHLLTNSAILEKVSGRPEWLPAVIEESLRLEPAAAFIDRYSVNRVKIAGATIRSGDLVRVSLAGANRDPEIFENPDQFSLGRPNLSGHIAFAQGPHVCLGLHLARMEVHEVLKVALQRLPGLRLAGSKLALAAARPRGLVFRKPLALHALWTAP